MPGAENERHVISFDDLPIESDCMKVGNNIFKEQFTQAGTFGYKC